MEGIHGWTARVSWDTASGQRMISEQSNFCPMPVLKAEHITFCTAQARQKKRKKLLDDITFTVYPGELVAVLGGSGAGKSTLLHALSGIVPATEGMVWIKGRNFYEEYEAFRSCIGYVPQHDIVHLDLTVEESLLYAARLRFHKDIPLFVMEQRVEEVLADLKMTKHRAMLVRNLSGGQRKRVSIGVELMTNPSLLLLDEITSGLDPGLEKNIMEVLCELKMKGTTIIMATHTTYNIHLYDKIVFLTQEGGLAFVGSPSEALTYFSVDSFVDIYQKMERENPPNGWAAAYKQFVFFEKDGHIHKNNQLFAAKSERDRRAVNVKAQDRRVKRVSSFIQQWRVLTERYVRLLTRDRRHLMILLLQAVFIPCLLVIAFYHSAPTFRYSEYRTQELKITQQIVRLGKVDEIQRKIQEEKNRRSFMSNAVALMVFTAIWLGTSNAAREIVKEQDIYRRERYVSVLVIPYLLSKITVLSIICAVQTFLLVSIVTYGLALPEFWLNFLAFFLLSLAGVMMGLVVSACVSTSDKAVSFVPILLVPQIILSGALVPLVHIKPDYIKGVFYLAVSKWGYELVGGTITNINSRSSLPEPLPALSGNFTLNWLIIIMFIFVLYGMAWIALLKKDRYTY
ncbi:ABC-type multidrug transport system, ATPase component [Aneurinibacillus thermoaerophilus]|uniref:ABC-type multidrug transport system, ATPase component n=1 Tax=Aneurinibacillus thermoaerophilus TaxID=143495 RepID=A0A1G8AT35_ANETH|nr:ATP-binding cassette domain-containing protein [Aneurinibacillus thermoaerophilus]SDH24158.1 ABC-type multidrug transport system, ATPase component [Aneurinibacillus thermoaerophilus]